MALRLSLLPSFLACSALLVSGELTFQSAPSAPVLGDELIPLASGSTQLPPLAQVSAAAILDRAIQVLTDVRWLEMTVWQRLDNEDGSFQIEGKFLQGPQQRLRLELVLSTGKATSRLRLLCDGQCFWQSLQYGQGEPETLTQKWTRDGGDPAAMAKERLRFLTERGLTGPLALLQNLRNRLQYLHKDTGLWRGRPVIRIGGHQQTEVPPDPEVPLLARHRHCYLYLDAETLWPCRLEWRVWERPNDAPRPWLQLEFRHPVVNRPPTPDVCAQVFRISDK